MRSVGIVLRMLEGMDFGTKLVLCVALAIALFVAFGLVRLVTWPLIG